jgi:hypothetical protein
VRLSQFCACDMENFGDVLYPLLLRHIVSRSLETAVVEAHAFLSGLAALGGNYRVHAIRELFRPAAPSLPLVVGGGDILRTDDGVIASHYRSRLPRPAEPIRYFQQQGDFEVTFSFGPVPWESDPLETFARQWMPPVRGAFLLSPRNCPGASRVVYFSAGVPFDIRCEDRPRIQAVFEESSFVYLRDEQSAEKLRGARVQRDLAVAPDAAVVVSDLFPKASLFAAANRLLSRVGLSAEEPYLCFQASAAATGKLPVIASQLRRFSRRHNMPIVLLPLGFCHGDREFLFGLTGESPDRMQLAHPRTVTDMLAILAHANIFAGVSMHGNICSYSYGVPHLFGALDVDKIDGAMRAMDLNGVQRISDWQELRQGLESLLDLDRAVLAGKQKRAAKRVYDVSRGMAAFLS